jgi:hypothetical protein
MAAYSYGSSYESLMKKNCGYRQLGNYYTGLYDNVTSDTPTIDNKIVVVPQFGQSGYNPVRENFSQGTDGAGSQCNTWRMGQSCDGRSLNKNAYTSCVGGVCPSYTDVRGLSGNSLYARY